MSGIHTGDVYTSIHENWPGKEPTAYIDTGIVGKAKHKTVVLTRYPPNSEFEVCSGIDCDVALARGAGSQGSVDIKKMAMRWSINKKK